MTAQTKPTLKGYFETNDTPTAAQFVNLIDTIGGNGGLLVAASNAPDAIRGRADYVCDGTDDHVEIQAAIDALSGGGTAYLSVGTFTIAAPLTIKAGVTLSGQGRNATIITAGAAYNNNMIVIGGEHAAVEHLRVTIPDSCLTDVITNTGQGWMRLSDLHITGGDSTTPYAVAINNQIRFTLDHLDLFVGINGIKIANTDNVWNYGNGLCASVEVHPHKAGCTAWMITGYTGGDGTKNVNLISYSYCGAVFQGEGAGVGSVGLHIVNAGYQNFDMLDIEGADTSVLIEGAVNSGHSATGNVFSSVYADNDVTLNAGAVRTTFLGGRIFGTYTDLGSNNVLYNTITA